MKNKKLKILHWPTSFPDPDRNQPYNVIFVQEHIKSTVELVNNRVLYVSVENTQSKYKWHERKNSVENRTPITRFYFNKSLNLTFLNIYIRLVLMIYFLELILIKRFYPNIIHIHFHQSFFWAKLYSTIFRIPIVITEHWSAFLGWPNIGKVRYKKAAQAFDNAKRILPVSVKMQDGISAYTGAEIDDRYNVIHNAVDSTIFNYEMQFQRNKEYINLIFIGRNAEEKDLPTLMQSIALIKKSGLGFKLHLVGNGDYYNIEDLITRYQLHKEIIIHGQQNKNAISKLLKQSDLLLLTSTIENSPCVIGEAHCCGLPVVATDVGGIKELIMEGTVVPIKSPELFAEKILEQLDKKIDREALAQKAQERFSYDTIGKQIFDIYQKVCAE